MNNYPQLTPGRITYWDLLSIVAWRQRHGLETVSRATVIACRNEGQSAASAGLELGLIDLEQATGDQS